MNKNEIYYVNEAMMRKQEAKIIWQTDRKQYE
jgi:hypothetical protein